MAEDQERWLPVVGYEGLYEVSDLGRVRRVRNRVHVGGPAYRLKKPEIDKDGYLRLRLFHEGEGERYLVHRLVARAFIGPPPDRKSQCCHNDGNPANNTLSNLRWDSIRGNRGDRVKHGTHNHGERHPMAILTEAQALEIIADNRTQRQIAADYGITQSAVHAIKARKSWKHLRHEHPMSA